MDFALLVNRRAGSTEPDLVERARRALATAGRVAVREMVGTDTGRIAAEHPGARLVVLGGDGTLHVAVCELWEADALDGVELALVPAGTGNDFARGIGLPLDFDEALLVAATGSPRRLDLIEGNDNVIVNAAHAGVGAEAARLAEPVKSVAGPAAYPLGAAAAGAIQSGWQVRVEAGGEAVFDGTALLVGICNAPSIGGGTTLCPGADPADGLLDVVVTGATGPVARAGFAAALQQGEHLDRDDVVCVRATTVEISGDPLRYDVDGEVGDEQATSSWRVAPGALQFVT